MKLNKTNTGANLEISKEELIKFLAKGLMKITGSRDFTFSANLPEQIFISLSLSRKLTKNEIKEQQEMLKRAEEISMIDFMDDFQNHTGNAMASKHTITRVTHLRAHCKTLKELISKPADELLKYRNIGKPGIDLLEHYVKSRGFRFATKNGSSLI